MKNKRVQVQYMCDVLLSWTAFTYLASHWCLIVSSDQIDENLRTALQLDLLAMAPGLRVQVRQRCDNFMTHV